MVWQVIAKTLSVFDILPPLNEKTGKPELPEVEYITTATASVHFLIYKIGLTALTRFVFTENPNLSIVESYLEASDISASCGTRMRSVGLYTNILWQVMECIYPDISNEAFCCFANLGN